MTQRDMDRCGRAHRRRELLNAAALQSLEDWAMSLAPAGPGAAVLDLGCGTGKLAIPYARAVGSDGAVLGVDIAPDSVAELQAKAKRENLPNVTARVGNLDDFLANTTEKIQEGAAQRAADTRVPEGRDTAGKFDLIVSSYAIYYATDMVGLLRSLAARLTDGGRVFVCGPGTGTNREMDELVRRAAPDVNHSPPLADFISPEQLAVASTAYTKFDTHRLDNTVRFNDADALLAWWRNHNMYVPAADEAVAQAVREHFARRGEFTMTKNVLGVLFCL